MVDRESESRAFECNICLDPLKDPVVTFCGHLFCWPCLYRWLEQPNSGHRCPVCNAGTGRDKVIPIYGRGFNEEDPRKKQVVIPNDSLSEVAIPHRPLGQRPPAMQRGTHVNGPYSMHLGFGVLPSLFGHHHNGSAGARDPMTPEQQHQAFLSRLLLMLGSFVIMCLLLF